jgi:hypothetical protein
MTQHQKIENKIKSLVTITHKSFEYVLSCYSSLLGMLVISKLVLAHARDDGMSKSLLFEKLPLQWRS